MVANVNVGKQIAQWACAVLLVFTAGLIGCTAREAMARTSLASLDIARPGTPPRDRPLADAIERATHLMNTGRCVQAADLLITAVHESPSNARAEAALARLYLTDGKDRRTLHDRSGGREKSLSFRGFQANRARPGGLLFTR